MPELKAELQNTQTKNHAPYSFIPEHPNTAKTAGNPLKQYFRRPAVHLKLPSGVNAYPASVVQYPPTGELPVYPMTAIDEITAKTPDAAFNGAAVADIIKSCVPSILDPWRITTVDLDAILVAIRLASVGQTMEIVSTCPECRSESDYDVDLVGVLQSLVKGDYDRPFVIDMLEIKLQPLDYSMVNEIAKQQYEFQRTMQDIVQITDDEKRLEQQRALLGKLNELNLNILLASIEYIRTPEATVTEPAYIAEFLRNCQKTDYDAITEQGVELRKQTQIKPLHVKCTECEHEYEQPYTVNPSDFFE